MVQMPVDYDKYIYHFTTAEKALLYILPNLEIKLSPYLKTNDPKENKTFGFWSIFEKCDDFKRIEIESLFKIFLESYCKIACFSTDYTISQNNTKFAISGFNHPTMWAHYGENYKGVCIVIDQKIFESDNYQTNTDLFDIVRYNWHLEFPSINQVGWGKKQVDYFKKFLIENAKDFFFTKHFHWQSENEKRFVHLGTKKFCSIKNSIAGIYLGSEFDDKLISLTERLLPNIRIDKISIIDGRLFPIPNWNKM